MFLSGFGLSYSWRKNSISQFYKNRFQRIYPIYCLAVLFTYIFFPLDWGVYGLLTNLLSIGFYIQEGVNRFDWYLESLITLYLLFPIFYYLGCKLKKAWGILLFLIAAITLFFFDLKWWYDCFISRIPIFYYGILYNINFKARRMVIVISILGLLLYLPCSFLSVYLAGSLLTMPLVISLLMICKKLSNKLVAMISFVGKYTLEIYIANLFVYWVVIIYPLHFLERIAVFLLIQAIGSIIIIWLNMKIQYCISKL